MSPPTAVSMSPGGTTGAENLIQVQTTEQLLRDTVTLLNRAGVAMAPRRLHRVVRAFTGRLTYDGADYITYLADKLRLTVAQRRDVADQYSRVIAYSDPTGETAVRNVMREVHR